MRQISFPVFSFDELSDEARRKAIERMTQPCYEHNNDWTWDDANQTLKRLGEIANVRADIDCSSQGWYVNRCWLDTYSCYHSFDDTDIELWERFVSRFKEDFKVDIWSDETLLVLFDKFTFNDNRSYERNVAELMLHFCQEIDESTYVYYDEAQVIEFIESNEYEFYENGTPFFG